MAAIAAVMLSTVLVMWLLLRRKRKDDSEIYVRNGRDSELIEKGQIIIAIVTSLWENYGSL